MIDGRELRFGNLFYWSDPEMDERIGKRTVGIVKSSNIGDSEFMDAIPLTEEWLENNFGFEKIDPVNSKIHHYPDYVKEDVIISLPYFEFTYNDGDNSRVIKYVHELMNLYYILTGEELEVKL